MKPRKTLTVLTLTAVTAATLATGSLAQEQRGPLFPFEAVDADKDGKVTETELNAYRAAQTAAIDADADGKLSIEELTAMHLARLSGHAARMATRMVENRDTDGDKALSAAELASRPMPAGLFARADADGDGAVTPAEIEAMQQEMKTRMGGRHGKSGQGMPGSGGFWDMMGDD